jgi:hypothetical protein
MSLRISVCIFEEVNREGVVGSLIRIDPIEIFDSEFKSELVKGGARDLEREGPIAMAILTVLVEPGGISSKLATSYQGLL